MRLIELGDRVDITRPFNYNTTLDITSNSGTDTKTIQIGIDDFLMQEILISGIDTDGDDVLENTATDMFRINIVNESGEGYTKEPIMIRSLNKLVNSNRFKGWVFRSQQKLTVEVSASSFPAAAKNTYPVKIQVNFMGYRLNKGM